MRFRTVVIAAALLGVLSVGGLAAYQMADEARGGAAQTTIETSDSLAVTTGITQQLTTDDPEHNPTAYGETITVVYNDTEWEPEGNYTYYQASGEIEFQRDEPDAADIDYRYDIPRDQLADEQLQTLTGAYGDVLLVGVGLTIVAVLLFVGGFTGRKIIRSSRSRRGR